MKNGRSEIEIFSSDEDNKTRKKIYKLQKGAVRGMLIGNWQT